MNRRSKSSFNYASLAIFGGVFVLGVGIGIAFSSSSNLSPQNFASREFLDRSAPNPEVCVQYGASAISIQSRIYVTLNPFNVYVGQPKMEPGCVLRRNNWAILERRNLITSEQVRDCKNRLNTFGYTGELEDNPTVECIYQNSGEGNDFLDRPGLGAPAPESDRF